MSRMPLLTWIALVRLNRRNKRRPIVEVPIDEIPDDVLDRIAGEVTKMEGTRRVRMTRAQRRAAWGDMSRGWEQEHR